MSTVVAPGPTNRFIDPTVLTKIENLELLARTVVEGFVQGLHKSPFLGFSVDFAEYRPYQPGDEIRRVDWNVWSVCPAMRRAPRRGRRPHRPSGLRMPQGFT